MKENLYQKEKKVINDENLESIDDHKQISRIKQFEVENEFLEKSIKEMNFFFGKIIFVLFHQFIFLKNSCSKINKSLFQLINTDEKPFEFEDEKELLKLTEGLILGDKNNVSKSISLIKRTVL